jgi:thiol-disulfide isomerase/thioredoxin
MKLVSTIRIVALALALSLALSTSCSPSTPPPGTPGTPHGKLSELSRVEGEIILCEHRVPEKTCTLHHPELALQFKRAGDWCTPHGVPESQCLKCHPDLTFEPLPKLSEGADVAWLSRAGEDVPDLDAHAVKGKVTVFDFYAEWCAACRKVDGHMYKKIAGGDSAVAYRKLNIVEWESALGQRYLKEVPSLPFLVVYGRDGKRFATLTGADVAALDKAIAGANAR